MKRFAYIAAILFLCSGSTATISTAEEMELSVEIPQLNVSEYHRPYVGIWIEDSNNQHVRNLAVWYQMREGKEGHGTKWLPDLRQWWRKSGRTLDVPVDGVTSATRPVGKQTLTFTDVDPQLKGLAAGNYTLVVEAAREVGGREMIKIPFTWPASASQQASKKGSRELGMVELSIKP